ncbi:MAG: flagellar motor protein [Elusimicrobiota bacterium]
MKPDIASFAGILSAVGFILVGQHLEGGHVGSIIQFTAFLIVIGGTIGATMLQFPLSVSIGAAKKLLEVFMGHEANLPALIKELLQFSETSRKEGLLALQAPAESTKEPFLKRALQLVVDGTEEKVIREMLENDIASIEEAEERFVKYFEAAGGYCPTVGIIGAVLGLIHVMENLDKPEQLGTGIAAAFVATIYGVAAANLLFLPASSKLKQKNEQHAKSFTIIIEAMSGIQRGENPNQLKERLRGYLPPNLKNSI